MAGIGFQLRKLFDNSGFFAGVRAYAYSSLVTVGPMLFCMVLISCLQLILKYSNFSFSDRELFLATVEYAFIFSLTITSGFTMLISRFVSDKIYKKEYEDILPSYIGLTAICIAIGGGLGIWFLWNSPLSIMNKLTAYLFYIELIVIWLQTVYISALKDYVKITQSMLSGVVVSALGVVGYIYWFGMKDLWGILLCLDIGFFVIIFMYNMHIRKFFYSVKRNYFSFITYLEKYPSLLFIGLFTVLGLYIHNFVYWRFSSLSATVADTFWVAPYYDVPVFYAFMSVIPTMVIFTVKLETNLYEKYIEYYSVVLQSGTVNDLKLARKQLYSVMMREVSFIMQIQLFFSIIIIALGLKFLPLVGLSNDEVEIFNILVIADYLYIMMYFIVLIMLYFDDRKGSMITASVFFASNVILSIVSLSMNNFGFTSFICNAASLIIALYRVRQLINDLNYYTFCSQPLVIKDKSNVYKRIIRRLAKD